MPQGPRLRGYIQRDPKRSNSHAQSRAGPAPAQAQQVQIQVAAPTRPGHARPKGEPFRSTFDTDVESIGDSTTFSLAEDDGLEASGVRYAYHRASPRNLESLGTVTAAQLLGEQDRDNYRSFVQENSPIRYGSAPPSPEHGRGLNEPDPYGNKDEPPRPTSLGRVYEGQDYAQQSPKSDPSASPTPRRRPIVRRASAERAVAKPLPPVFTATKKRMREATAQAFNDANTHLHAGEHADDHDEPDDDDPFTSPTKLNHTMTSVSDISNSSDERARTNKKLDYDSKEISSISYSELAAQPFDFDPRRQAESTSPAALPTDDIAGELNRLRGQQHGSVQAQTDSFRSFFAQLDIEQHEAAGDMLMEKLMGVLSGLKQIRRDKRAAAIELERHVNEREETVKGKQERLVQSMERLRKQGQDVIKGPS